MPLSSRDVEIAANLSELKEQNRTIFRRLDSIVEAQEETNRLLRGSNGSDDGLTTRVVLLEDKQKGRVWAVRMLGASTVALIGRAVWNSITKDS